MIEQVTYWSGLDLGQQQDFSALATLRRTEWLTEEPKPVIVVEESAATGRTTTFYPDRKPVEPLHPRRITPPRRYELVGLRRWDLGTSYTQIVSDVADLFNNTPPMLDSTLGIDRTGVGMAVYDQFANAVNRGLPCEKCDGRGLLPLDLRGTSSLVGTHQVQCPSCAGNGRIKTRAKVRPVTITGGAKVTEDGAGFNVAKKELVSALQVVFQGVAKVKGPDGVERTYRRLAINTRIGPLVKVLVKELENFKVKVTEKANETFEAWREKDHDDLVLAVAIAVWLAERGNKEFWMR